MNKILIAVSNLDYAREWAESFKQQSSEWTFHIWTPESPPIGAHYAVVWQPPQALFKQEKNLKAVFNLGAGVDALGVGTVIPKELPVYRVEDGGMAAQMAEYAIYGVILATGRFDVYARQQAERRWQTHAPILRAQWPVGVMGYGQIGAQVAQSVAQLGYTVAAWARSKRTETQGVELFTGAAQFEQFLQRTRILINVLPLTDATRGIINRRTLALLRPDGFVINMARGAHVVDEDLLAAVRSRQLRGALLDVFHTEPLPAEHPFWTEPGITITPHIAGISMRQETTAQIMHKIALLQQGQEPSGRVDTQLQY